MSVTCPECGQECVSGFGFSSHWGQTHEGPVPDEIDTSLSESHRAKVGKSGEDHHFYGVDGEDHPMYGVRGEDHPMHGHEMSEESRRKISEAMQGRDISWSDKLRKDGPLVSKEDYPDDWQAFSKSVRELIGECRICGDETLIDVHHIDGDKENCSRHNLIVLCRRHHAIIEHSDLDDYESILLYGMKECK